MPRISVIVPVYKVEEYLHRCVRSIQAQTHRDLEIILVDDGSPDGCGAVCDEFAALDDRIKVIHKENGGLSDARNAGLDIATGEFIGFVDSDDHIAPTMYERLLQVLECGEADMSLCGYDLVDDGGAPAGLQRCPLKTGVLSREAALEAVDTLQPDYFFYVTAWNRLYRRRLFDGLRFPKGKLHEDEFTAHLLFDRCRRVAVTEEALYHYVQRGGSIMRSRPTARSLDGVYALYDRYAFYRQRNMKAQAKNVLAAAVWKLGDLMEKLPPEDNGAVAAAVRLLLPAALARRPKSAALLSKDCLRRPVRQLREKIRHRRCLKAYETHARDSFVLLDTPEHENLGDHAIVLAQLQLFGKVCPGVPVWEVTAQQLEGREVAFARLTPPGKTVFIHGGGFMGCLWPEEEARLRRLLQAFHRQRVVIFPQTVTFDLTTPSGRAYLRRSREIYCGHPDLTVFVREAQSLAFVQTHFPGVKVCLVPDTVLSLDMEITRRERRGVLLCLRRDPERKLTEAQHRAILENVEQAAFTDTVEAFPIAPKHRDRAVRRKLEEFAGAQLVITDRLHGMIFAALTGTPCIAFGNSNGKVGGVARWLGGCVQYLEDPADLPAALAQGETACFDPASLAEAFEPLKNTIAQSAPKGEL